MSAFLEVSQELHATQAGAIGLPILYYNSTAIFACFLVDADRAAHHLPDALEPVLLAPGRALVTVAFFHYIDSSVGPYQEMGLAIGARPVSSYRKHAPFYPHLSLYPGMYVLDLPVTTEVALHAGRDLWGYPKTVTPIDVQLRAGQIDCAVLASDRAEALCALRGRAGRAWPWSAPNLLTYTCKQGQLLRTTIRMRGTMHVAQAGDVRLELGTATQDLGRHMHDLGLAGRRPFIVQYGQGLRARLPAGDHVQ